MRHAHTHTGTVKANGDTIFIIFERLQVCKVLLGSCHFLWIPNMVNRPKPHSYCSIVWPFVQFVLSIENVFANLPLGSPPKARKIMMMMMMIRETNSFTCVTPVTLQLIMRYGGISDACWRISPQNEIKPSGCFTPSNHRTWASLIHRTDPQSGLKRNRVM